MAAHPRDQGKGYMKALMSRALEACIASGADFSFLSGRRQRYGYFSYEKAGTVITASIDERNLRHCFPEPDGRKIEIAPLLRENEAHLRAWSTPVSYTHLDVYKRQLVSSSEEPLAQARSSARPSRFVFVSRSRL